MMGSPHASASVKLLAALSGKSDDEWLQLNLEAYRRERAVKGSADGAEAGMMSRALKWAKRQRSVDLPGFPDDDLQERIVGACGEDALREGFAFYREVTRAAETLSIPLGKSSHVLDFGCGWGRIIRYFLKCVRAENLLGTDVEPSMIDVCMQTNPYCRFVVGAPEPPLSVEAGVLDVIYAFSVFSHLSSEIAERWIAEFARLLKPGGILVVTTQPRHFISFCLHWQTHPPQRQWHELLAKAFPDTQQAFARYDAGEFLYVPTGGGGVLNSSFYGEAMVPRQHVERYWTRYLALREFVSDPARCAQAIIIMQNAAH
jgi:ubiquinone/menaquinone biosynthesis C-methylase UbiE